MKFLSLYILLFPIFLNSQSKLESSMENGKSIYIDFCLRCHLSEGEGVEGIYPPLAKSDYLFKNIKQSIIAVKQGGIDGDIIVNGKKYEGYMENMGLYSDEVADVMNYILNSRGNNYNKIITEEYVDELTKKK